MNNHPNNRFEPVCKFGPGGDFVFFWPNTENKKETSEYAITSRTAYSPSITIIKGDCRFLGEPLLFADDWRTGSLPELKQKHHIRTYHRTAKKGTPFCAQQQDSLFAADLQSAKTA